MPKLIDTSKQYMQYEQDTLENITKARSGVISAQESNDVAALGVAENMMRQTVGKLFALAENYPDLKANQTFQQLQTRIGELENSISDRRVFYNESVKNCNIRIEQFPDATIAKLFNYRACELLKFSATETAGVDVSSAFKK